MKKSNLILASAAIAAAAFSMPAAAQSSAFQPGFYIGAGFGQSHVSNENQSGTVGGVAYTTQGFGDNKTTAQINGGYQFTEMWGLEVQYTDLGKRSGTITALGTTVATGDIKAYQWGISGTGTYMITDQWFARGKLGVSSNHIDDRTIAIGASAFHVGGGNHNDVLAGIGVGYKWNQNFSSRLEYEYFGKFSAANGATSEAKASNIGLRMQYKF